MLFWESCRNSLLFAVVLLVVGCSSVTNLNKTAESVEATGVQNDPDYASRPMIPLTPVRLNARLGQALASIFLGATKKKRAPSLYRLLMTPNTPNIWNGSAGVNLRLTRNGKLSRALPTQSPDLVALGRSGLAQ